MSLLRLPTVAIVGRPNVGKSSLFNALLRKRSAIVDNIRGVTRDRLYGMGQVGSTRFHVIDTGGFEPDSKDPIFSAMRDQARLAIDEADVVVFVTDSQDGVLPPDLDIADLLRRSGCATVVAVNKVDDPVHEVKAAEFFELGLQPLVNISATHRRGLGELTEEILQLLPEPLRQTAQQESPEQKQREQADLDLDMALLAEEAQEEDEAPAEPWLELPGEIAVAVVGRPNVGKSTLINSLLGEPRLLVADMPGTTRDAVDTVVEHNDRKYRLIDTAGLRRKRSIARRVERYSVVASLKAVERAEAVVLVVDAAQPVADQDRRVASHTQRQGKALVLVANKMDLVAAGDKPRREVLREFREGLHFVDDAPICSTTAIRGSHVFDVLKAVDQVVEQQFRRIPTSAVNRTIEDVSKKRPPPVVARGRAKLLFGAQVAVAPPTFVIVCRRPDAIPASYRKYVTRRIREDFGFFGVPLLVAFRSRETQKKRSAKHRRREKKDEETR